jgi:drug/metabolite transporter (DMT)-like permease
MSSLTTRRPPLARAYVLLAFGIFCIGFSAIFVKLADLPGSTSGFYRLGLASIALSIPYVARRSKHPAMSRRVFGFAALGGLFFALDVWTWQSGLIYASAASATLLGNTSSIIVALGAWLIFHEKLHLPFWTGLFIAFAGVLLVLALLGAFFYAGYLLTTQHTRAQLDTVAYLFLMSSIGALILLGLTIAQGDPLWGFSIKSWLALLGLALFSHVMGWLAISYALGHIRASLVSVTLLGQPVLTALFSIPLLGEDLIPLQVIGGLLVLSGIYIVNRFGRK